MRSLPPASLPRATSLANCKPSTKPAKSFCYERDGGFTWTPSPARSSTQFPRRRSPISSSRGPLLPRMAPKKKLQLPPPPTDEEEYWDSQAEEVLDEEEEDMMEDWESLDEEASEAEEVSDETPSPSVAFPSPAPQKSATGPSMATTSAPQDLPALPHR
ncbi:encapsidation protein 22K [Human mastadenovirus C]|uniref:Encapsidation protein 22K n=1 Tax=Human mastadenovirus C TaxID=129951 RepID=A0A7D0PIW4_9ADEN|nr:encapsidation protein 22K [Human mastadenovirus C]